MQANTSAPNMPDSAWMLCSMWIKGVCIGLTHHDSHLNCSKVSKYQALCALLEINLQYSGSQLENRLFWKSPLLSLLVHLSVSTQRHRRHFCWDISQIPALIITKYSRLSSIINLYSKVVVVSSISTTWWFLAVHPCRGISHLSSLHMAMLYIAMLDNTCQCYALSTLILLMPSLRGIWNFSNTI